MSTTVLETPAPRTDNDTVIDYRAIYSGALVSALLGFVSLFMLAVTDFLEVALLVAVIPVLGIVMSLMAIRKINNTQEIYTGKPFALFGLLMSSVLLVTGVGRAAYIHATEVPEGYERISFYSLQPSEKDAIAGRAVPKDIAELMGKKIFIKGYIRPDSVHSRKNIDRFLLVRDNKNCCFGDLQSVKYWDQMDVKIESGETVDYEEGVFRATGHLVCYPHNLGRGPQYPVYGLVADHVE